MKRFPGKSAPWAGPFALVLTMLWAPALSVAAGIEGQIYSSSTAAPVKGVRVELRYGAGDVAAGELVPGSELGADEQGQVTASDGRYRFEVPAGRAYRIVLDADATGYSAPSVRLPPRQGNAPAGPVSPARTPAGAAGSGADTSYYLEFAPQRASAQITNNHLPIDPLTEGVSLTQRFDRHAVAVGEVVTATYEIINRSGRDLTAASGRAVSLVVVAPRGLEPRMQAIGALRHQGAARQMLLAPTDFEAGYEGAGSLRLAVVRRLELPRGARLTLTVPLLAAADVRVGEQVVRAALRDPGGVPLAVEAAGTLVVVGDAVFDEAVVLGSVFCDDDGDGRRDPQERGVYGARVVTATAAAATTDVQGRFHLSRLAPGQLVLKLDLRSLAGGLATEPTRLLTLVRGAGAVVSFPVRCVRKEISFGEHGATITEAPGAAPAVEVPLVVGRLDGGDLVHGGVRHALPALALSVTAALGSAAPRAPPAGPRADALADATFVIGEGAQFAVHTDTAALRASGLSARWELVIVGVDRQGVPGRALRTLGQSGLPPATIAWDGKLSSNDQAAATPAPVGGYAARLTLFGRAALLERASPWIPLAITAAPRTTAQQTVVSAAALGDAEFAAVSPALERALAATAAAAAPNTAISATVHASGARDRLSSLAQTSREAELVLAALVRLGVDPARLEVRGRGTLDAIDPATGPEARERNRRIELRFVTTSAVTPVALPSPVVREGLWSSDEPTATAAPLVLGADQEVRAAAPGRYLVLESVSRGRAVIDTRRTPEAPSPAVEAAPPPTSYRLEGDLESQRLAVEGTSIDLSAWRASLAPTAGARDGVILVRDPDTGAFREPLVLAAAAPTGFAIVRWQLELADASGALPPQVALAGGAELPAQLSWSGSARETALPATAVARLVVEGAAAERSVSAPVLLSIVELGGSGAAALALDREGSLFRKSGKPNAALKNTLSRFVSRVGGRADAGWLVVIFPAAQPLATVTDRMLASAARKASIESYLVQLGLPRSRFRVLEAAPTGGRDRLIALPAGDAPSSTPEVRVAGEAVTLQGSRFELSRPLAGAATVVVELRDAAGHYLSVPVAPPPPPPVAAVPAPAAAPPARVARPRAIAASEVVLWLPPAGATLGDRQLAVTGRTLPGNRLRVLAGAEGALDVGRGGEVTGVLALSPKTTRVRIESVDPEGNRAVLEWPLAVSKRSLFFVGHAEGLVGSSYTERGWLAAPFWLDGMTTGSSRVLGPLVISGRAAFFLDAWLSGAPLADELHVTAALDTARPRTSGAFFTELDDPYRAPEVFGDAAVETRPAEYRGKLFVELAAEHARLRVGNERAGLSHGTLFHFDDAVSGVSAEARPRALGLEFDLRGVASTGTEDLVRGHDIFRSTGAALYFLRSARVLEGSERVEVSVQDARSGLVIERRLLVRGTDYTIDYAGGRLRLSTPVGALAGRGVGVDDLGGGAGSNRAVYLAVEYDHEAGAAERSTVGARASLRSDEFSASIAAVGPLGDEAQAFSMIGASAQWARGDSRAVLEIARSDQRNGASSISRDGGLSFEDALRTAETTTGLDEQWAWRLSEDLRLRDVYDRAWAERARVSAYLQEVDRGFSGHSMLLEQGRLKAGFGLSYETEGGDRLTARHDAVIAQVPAVGPTAADIEAADPLRLHEWASYRSELGWSRTRGSLGYRAGAMVGADSSTQPLATGAAAVDSERVGATVGVSYAPSENWTLRADQHVVLARGDDPVLAPIVSPLASERDHDRLAGVATVLGTALRLSEEVALDAELRQRWNGDADASVGLSSALSETGKMYVRQGVAGQGGRLGSQTIVGAEDALTPAGGRRYGEYRLANGMRGARAVALLGMGHRFVVSPGVRLDAGFEHQQVFGGHLADGTPVGDNQREVVRGGLEFVRERLRVALSSELRYERGGEGNVDPAFVAADPRSVAGSAGFADHGGALPLGGTLYLPAGERYVLSSNAGAALALNPAWTALFRADWVHVNQAAATVEEAPRYRQWTLGAMWRPPAHEELAALARYSYVSARHAAAGAVGTDAHVVAVLPMAELPWRLTLAGKLAVKAAQAGRDEMAVSATSLLATLRVGYRFAGRWDASVEGQGLRVVRDQAQDRVGALLELGLKANRYLRIGGGYNLSHFSDNELGDLERDAHGVFLRVTGLY